MSGGDPSDKHCLSFRIPLTAPSSIFAQEYYVPWYFDEISSQLVNIYVKLDKICSDKRCVCLMIK